MWIIRLGRSLPVACDYKRTVTWVQYDLPLRAANE